MSQIKASNFKFLKDLKKNNNRDWFTENKKRYQNEHEEIISFADALLTKMNEHDVIETPSGKKSLFRIYRDVRFSKDKSPYKTHWAGGFKRATAARRGGYYFHIQPGDQSFIGGGFCWFCSVAYSLYVYRKKVNHVSVKQRHLQEKRQHTKNILSN